MSDFERIESIEKHDKHNNPVIALPPPIPMKLEMPKLEAQIAKSKSKTAKKKPIKDNKTPHKAAMESVQG